MSKTSWQMRTHLMHEKVQLFSEYHPISAKGSQGSGKETWNMLRMCVDRGSSERRYCGCRHWKAGKFERVRNPCSKNQRKRSNEAQKMFSSNFPIVDGTTKLFGRDYGDRESTQRRERSGTAKKLGRISTDRNKRWRWSSQRQISFIVTTSILEFNFTCQKKETFQFHWNTLTWPGWRTQIWICCEKAVSTTIGMSMWIEMWKFTLSK